MSEQREILYLCKAALYPLFNTTILLQGVRYQTKAVCEHVVNLHLIVGQSGMIFHSKFSGYFHPFILETCCLQSSLQLLNNMRTSITALKMYIPLFLMPAKHAKLRS